MKPSAKAPTVSADAGTKHTPNEAEPKSQSKSRNPEPATAEHQQRETESKHQRVSEVYEDMPMVSADDSSRVVKGSAANQVLSGKSKHISNNVDASGTTKDEPLKHKKKTAVEPEKKAQANVA